jgi:hypothetical protein
MFFLDENSLPDPDMKKKSRGTTAALSGCFRRI